jgi:hypothetical protein
MSRAKLRRLKRATTIQGERSFTIHNFVDDLPRSEDDASFAQLPQTATNSAANAAEEAASNTLAQQLRPLAAHKKAV